jgi:hypothetical protein
MPCYDDERTDKAETAFLTRMKLTREDIFKASYDAVNSTTDPVTSDQGFDSPVLPKLKISHTTFLLIKNEAKKLGISEIVLVTALLNRWQNPSLPELVVMEARLQSVTPAPLTDEIDLSPKIGAMISREVVHLRINETPMTVRAAILVEALINDWLGQPEVYRKGLAAEIRQYREDLRKAASKGYDQ